MIITGGEGWFQEEGKPAQLLKTGVVVNIPPHVNNGMVRQKTNKLQKVMFSGKNITVTNGI